MSWSTPNEVEVFLVILIDYIMKCFMVDLSRLLIK